MNRTCVQIIATLLCARSARGVPEQDPLLHPAKVICYYLLHPQLVTSVLLSPSYFQFFDCFQLFYILCVFIRFSHVLSQMSSLPVTVYPSPPV